MDVYGKSDIGLVRKTNQDDIKFKKINDETLWTVVCDGMGGAKGGDVAGVMAAAKIAEVFDEYFNEEEERKKEGKEAEIKGEKIKKEKIENDIKAIMSSAVVQAGDSIFEASRKNPELNGMGTTVVAAILREGILHVVHVGDSRAYIINDSGINQITTDHSIVQEMLRKGEITKEQAGNHPQRNVITRALGIESGTLPDYTEVKMQKGDKALFCTDGLTNELLDEEIYKIFQSVKSEEISDNLIKEANSRKGADNITVAIIV